MIAVSAGHGAGDPGAVFNGYTEREAAVRWAAAIVARLNGLGVPVFEVPEGKLSAKIAAVNSRPEVKVAIEVHFNAGSTKASGCETLHNPGSVSGERLARKVQSAMASFCAPNRGVKEGWYRQDPALGKLAWTDKIRAVSIIVEPLFIHERDRIEAMADIVPGVIADALAEFYREM